MRKRTVAEMNQKKDAVQYDAMPIITVEVIPRDSGTVES